MKEKWLVYIFLILPPQKKIADKATKMFGFDAGDGIGKKKTLLKRKDNKLIGFKVTENGDWYFI